MSHQASLKNFLTQNLSILCILALAACTVPNQAAAGNEISQPVPTAAISQAGPAQAEAEFSSHVVVISLDGCRPEYFNLVELPNLQAMIDGGVTYSEAWVGAFQNNTPPGHTQISTGTFPNHNGILGFSWGDGQGGTINPTSQKAIQNGEMAQIVAQSGVPTLSGLFKAQDPNAVTIALSSHKIYAAQGLGMGPTDYILYSGQNSKKPSADNNIQGYEPPQAETLSPSAIKGHAPADSFLNDPALQTASQQAGDDSRYVFNLAVHLFETYQPRLLMINVPEPDGYGHRTGGLSDPDSMRQVMLGIDQGLGRLMETYRQAGIYDQTLWVITADHGMTAGEQTYPNSIARQSAQINIQGSRVLLPFTTLKDPSQAAQVGEQIQAAKLPGVVGVYARILVNGKYTYQLTGPIRAEISLENAAALDQAYLYLLDTFASQGTPDIIVTSLEGVMYSGKEGFKGGHSELNWANQHIQIILNGPGVKQGIISDAPARLIDLAPTIVRLAGISTSDPVNLGMDGIVLSDALLAPTPADISAQETINAWLAPLRDALRSFAAEQRR